MSLLGRSRVSRIGCRSGAWDFLWHTVDGERRPTEGVALITTCLVHMVALALGTVLVAVIG